MAIFSQRLFKKLCFAADWLPIFENGHGETNSFSGIIVHLDINAVSENQAHSYTSQKKDLFES
ncbi:hypothetical protein [Nostoc sp. LEGE 12450]|uniref:hypothetical protein n=1 Tax=Nostoc sp. LEGE 12450 TaxID=1828643 RepID=UPI00187F62C2|nr:hypothetical protein [Nostoc sp. LEGE 12450]MBE8988180.1 hypothetical protein [Nostoc sp. LEGE 12450]